MVPRLLLILGLLCLVATGPIVGAEEQHRCAACGKPITDGAWIQTGGKYVHRDCFVCTACRKPIATGTFQVQDGKYYDSACYVNQVLPKCAYCGEPVGFQWVTYDDRPYHRTCYETHVALKCSLCGEIIEGPYLRDIWGNSYHERHKNEPRCLSCGRIISPASNGGETYTDGRTICGLCVVDAIKKPKEAQQIMFEVKSMLTELGIPIDRDHLPLRLIDRDRLAQVSIERRDNLELEAYTHFEKQTMLLGLFTERKFNIYVLYGLPRLEYTAVIAHELMHVWLGLNAPMDQDDAMVEGTCNYASYLVLKRLGTDEAERQIQQMTDSPDEVYGEGFRRVLAQVKSDGLASWLEYLTDNTAPPW